MPDTPDVRPPRRIRLRLWWYRWARTRTSVIAVLIILGAAAGLMAFLPRVEERNVAGTVRCMSGRPVVGVYVHDSYPGSGDFAPFESDGIDRAFVRYQRDTVRGSAHSISVGCGGSPKAWGTDLDSPRVTGEYHDFLCYDVAGALSGRCVLAGPK